MSDDGRELTFYLRKDVKFHAAPDFTPTRNLNADDVIYTFDRMRNPTHPYHKQGGANYQYYESMEMNKIIVQIVRVDDYTVRFKLDRPEAPILANLAMEFASITSKEYAEHLIAKKKQPTFDSLPVGTGPFQFVGYDKNKVVHFARFANYFGGPAKIEKLDFVVVLDGSQRAKKLIDGTCDIIASPLYEDIALLKKTPNVKVTSQPGLNIFYLAFNVTKAPFDKPEVRQAISHALNKSSYIQAAFKGFAQVAKNPIPPIMWGFNKTIQDYDYDLTTAKDLMKKAGYAKGFTTSLSYMSESRPYNPNGLQVAQLMAADLAKIGIKLNLVTHPWADYLNKARKHEFDILQMGWTGDNGDPDNFFNVLLSCAGVEGGTNYSGWCDKRFSFLTGRARVTTNIVQRTRFYEEAQKIFKQQAPWVTIAHTTVFRAMKTEVEGYRMSPFGVDTFQSVGYK